MHPDDLDDRIRGLVRSAVAVTPPSPELPDDDLVVTSLSPRPVARSARVWAAVGIAAAIAAIAVVQLRDDAGTSTPVSSAPETTAPPTWTPSVTPWPAGVDVIVASDRGIERVTAGSGVPVVVAPLLEGVAVDRAIELADGTIVYQTTGDGVVRILGSDTEPLATGVSLQDAEGTLASGFRVLVRTPSDAVSVLTADAEPTNVPMPNPDGPAWGRLSLVDDTEAVASATDGATQRSTIVVGLDSSGETSRPAIEDARLVVGDGASSFVVLHPDGQVTSTGVRSGVLATLDDPLTVTDMELRGEWLTVQRQDGTSELHDLVGITTYDVPVASGTVTLSRRELTSVMPTATTVPNDVEQQPLVADGEPFPDCVAVSAPTTDGVNVGQGFTTLTSLDPLPEETITVSGRPATLMTAPGELGVALRQPDWCSTFMITTTTLDRAAFLQWLDGVTVTESLPPTMPPVVVRSAYGLSVVSSTGTRVVTRGAVDQALLLADGRVVYHAVALTGFEMWDPATGTSTPIWTSVDFVAMPRLEDAYLDTFVYSVAGTLYAYGSDGAIGQSTAPSSGRVSVTDDLTIFAGDRPTTIDRTGATKATVDADGAVIVVSTGDGVLVFRRDSRDSTIGDLDLQDGWLMIAETPPGDGAPLVRMIELATGRTLTLDDTTGGHLGTSTSAMPMP